MQFIIIYGNPIEGFNYRGPFDTYEVAIAYWLYHHDDGEYWITELNPPEYPAEATDEERNAAEDENIARDGFHSLS